MPKDVYLQPDAPDPVLTDAAVEELAGVGGHRFFFAEAALRTANNRCELHHASLSGRLASLARTLQLASSWW